MKKIYLTSIAAIALTATAAIAAPGERGKADANGDGVLTKAEMTTSTEERFARMDANNDGQLDSADREAKKAERFAKVDTDSNGQVSLAEMQAVQAERTAKRFARMDADNNGALTAEEMTKRGDKAGNRGKRGDKGKRGGRRGGKGGQAMMKQADTDGNGSISQAEFTAGAMQRFDKMDANSDGQVTAEERKAAREARGGKGKRGGGRG